MRSKVSHFSGIIRFVIFLCVILLLVYVIVHWSRQNKHQPVATNPSNSSQAVDSADKDSATKANNGKSTAKPQTDTPKSSSSNKPSSSDSTKADKPTKIAGDTNTKSTKPKQQPVAGAVPSTGLSLAQTIVATAGIGLTIYLTGNYLQTRDWHQASR